MNKTSIQKKSQKKLLFVTIFLSIILHVLALYLLKDYTFKMPSVFMPKQSYLGEDSLNLYAQSLKKKNQDLENIFNRLMAQNVLPKDVKFDFKDLDTTFISKEENLDDLEPIPFEVELSSQINPTFSLQEIAPLTETSIIDSLSKEPDSIKVAYELTESNSSNSTGKPIEKLNTSSEVFQQSSLVDLVDPSSLTSNIDINFQAVGLKEPTLPSSENYFTETDNEDAKRILASSSDFMVNVEYMPQLNEDGYIFKISLSPKPYKHFKRIKQNFFFLIDRSHSISVKNYQASKDAVSSALDYLHPGDTFNILIFDGKVVKLSSQNMDWNPKNASLARQFLKNQKHGGFFATTDLYSSLDKIIPEAVEEDEVNCAILLSDGDTYINKQKQRKTLNYWSQKNKGKVSLFTLAIGKQNNLPLLDLLSTFNKGSLRVARTKETISIQLISLIKALRSPIGKDLIVTALPHNSNASVQIYPAQERLPNLYENLEYVLYGSINQSSDFTLFLQGRYYDHWLDIKKSISLSKGTLTDDMSLKKGVLLQKAYLEYEQFLRSGHPEFLEKAKKLLQPIQLPLAFE